VRRRPSSLEWDAVEGDSPVRSVAKLICRSFEESRSLGMLRKVGGMLLLRLNTGQRPIAHK
jgi:hypothetical protein